MNKSNHPVPIPQNLMTQAHVTLPLTLIFLQMQSLCRLLLPTLIAHNATSKTIKGTHTDETRKIYLFSYSRHICKIKEVTSYQNLPYNSNYPDDVNFIGKNTSATQQAKALCDVTRKMLATVIIHNKSF